jgi:hypothetical protein
VDVVPWSIAATTEVTALAFHSCIR